MISFGGWSSIGHDPSVIPYPSDIESYGAAIPLSLAKLSYVTIQWNEFSLRAGDDGGDY